MRDSKETWPPGVSMDIPREFQRPLGLCKHVCSHIYFNPQWNKLGLRWRMLALEESLMRNCSCPIFPAQKLSPREGSGFIKEICLMSQPQFWLPQCGHR